MSGPVTVQDVPAARLDPAAPEPPTVELSESRVAEVGGLRVRRALPKRGRRTVGAWCFVDHVGPATLRAPRAVEVGPHPHCGLQTVTWLLEGEQVHRDSLGSEQLIRPGQLNLMTAGGGVAHAEESLDYSGPLHGVQLWVAQPAATRHGAGEFDHVAEPPRVELPHGEATVLLGAFADATSPGRTDTPLVGVDLALRPGLQELPLLPGFEYALVVLAGAVRVDDTVVEPGRLAYLGEGRDELPLEAREDTRVLLLGGEPFEAPVLMWWNFVARTREEIDAAYADWRDDTGRFGRVHSDAPRIPAPVPPWWPGP
jgi:hypothetical protein